MKKKIVLFISYYFYPNHFVGANRVNYWAKSLNAYDDIEVQVISAVPFIQNEKLIENQFYVENTNTKSLLGSLIKDLGVSWFYDLKFFFNSNYIHKPDVVVISGSPFMHFGIAKLLKIKYNSKVILDYRDPFANNPRFKNSQVKIAVKKFYQNKFNGYADIVSSVNDDCLNLLGRKSDNNQKFKIIENGFDDIEFNNIKSVVRSKENRVIYTGKFYENVSPESFLEAFEEFQKKCNWLFCYLGSSNVFIENQPNVLNLGYQTYEEVAKNILKSKIGIIFTGGDSFESSTKIFDYIAGKLSILVITNGKHQTGNIGKILENYPSVIWCNNNRDQIFESLTQLLSNADVINFDSFPFSRANGTKKLLSIINSL